MKQWESLVVDRRKKEEIKKILNDIYVFLTNSKYFANLGVLNGFSSIILFLANYYKYSNSSNVLSDLYIKIEVLFSSLGIIKDSTLCGGYAGICWLIRNLHRNGIVDSDDINDTLEEIDMSIVSSFYKEYINDSDYLHGGLGIAHYFLLSETKYGIELCKAFVDKLNDNKTVLDDGSCMWISKVTTDERDIDVANFSLSHGMSAIIIFLAEYFKKTQDVKAKRLLGQVLMFYMNNTNPHDFCSIFCNWIDIKLPHARTESRLAWCYGDLGIGVALSFAGNLLNNNDVLLLSSRVLDKSLSRDISNSQIVDATICHGTSGVSYIFNYLYQTTGNQDYKNRALFWLDETINKAKLINYKSDYIKTNQLTDAYSVLTGLSGLGLSLLSSIDSAKENWGEILLLLGK